MWNTVILPILTSLAATGLGILLVWIFNTKRREDKISNEIAGITNKIEAVEAKMDNGFNRENLEKNTLLNAFNSAKTEMEQANKDTALKQREFYQDIIERIHIETVARKEFSYSVKTSIDNLEKEVANNSELIAKLEKEVAANKESINRMLNSIESYAELIKSSFNN